jgi:NADPH:quinone reductase-like Zn-dependent oxidoreductase
MKAVVFHGAGRVEVVDVPMPGVGAEEVLVKMIQ